MFNLLISYDSETWNNSPYECDRSRAIVEHTVTEISERYKDFTENTIEKLKSFPTLFVTENEAVESRIGYITDIKLRQKSVIIHFKLDSILPPLPQGAIEAIRSDIDLGRTELSRTHWAIKDEPIFEILIRHGYINQQQLDASQNLKSPQTPVLTSSSEVKTSQVFIVHGHDSETKTEVARFIEQLGLKAIILHEQASSGKTIIEKIERYSDVDFAVVLYTPDDIGTVKTDKNNLKYRARQNVVFEHGFLIGKLGRDKVSTVVKGKLELPNDISGVVYMNEQNWKLDLAKEMKSVGFNIDFNKLL